MSWENDQNDALREFLRQFRICHANASTYAEGHQIFRKSIETLRQKLMPLFASLSQLDIFVGSRFLQINGERLEGDPLFEETARFFHYRNIKSIKISPQITDDELNHFFTKVGKRPREIFKMGGIPALLKEHPLKYLEVEMLDYSQILKSTKEDKDVWLYLLREAMQGEDLSKVDEIVAYFGDMLHEVGLQDVLKDGEMQDSIVIFLSYLQKNKKMAHAKCMKIFIKSILDVMEGQKDLEIPQSYQTHIKILCMDDFAEILMDELLAEKKKDLFVFDFFDRIIKPHEHADLASSLTQTILKRPSKKINAAWLVGTVDLLKDSKNAVVINNYIQPLTLLRDKIDRETAFYFNTNQVAVNFRAALINLIAVEKSEEVLAEITKHILKECEILPDQDKTIFYQMVMDVLKQREDQDRLKPVFDAIYRSIGNFVESAILQGKEIPEFEQYMRYLKVSTLNPDKYLDKIFDPAYRQDETLTLFFKFFPSNGFMFCERLRPRLHDTKYILEWVERFRSFSAPGVLHVLKFIYNEENLYVKIAVIKIMETLEFADSDFLLSIIRTKSENIVLKETATSILLREERNKKPLLAALFEVGNSLGRNNALLLENIAVVQKFEFRDARDYLVAFSKSAAIWSGGIRDAAQQVLKEWGYGNY